MTNDFLYGNFLNATKARTNYWIRRIDPFPDNRRPIVETEKAGRAVGQLAGPSQIPVELIEEIVERRIEVLFEQRIFPLIKESLEKKIDRRLAELTTLAREEIEAMDDECLETAVSFSAEER